MKYPGKKYICMRCDAEFYTRNGIRIHRKRKHK